MGSHARGEAGPASDVDFVVLVEDPRRYAERDDWVAGFGGRLVRTARWGVLVERRVQRGGLELDLGFAAASWAGDDEGTRRVADDGLVVLHDPHGLLARLA